MNNNQDSKIIIAIDYGTKRIGVAVGNLITDTAQPLTTIDTKVTIDLSIKKICKEWCPKCIVLGYPNANKIGSVQQKILKFKNHLKNLTSLDVYLVDESYSSLAAIERIKSYKKTDKIKKEEIDAQSACIIAEQWMRGVRI